MIPVPKIIINSEKELRELLFNSFGNIPTIDYDFRDLKKENKK